MMNPNPKSPPPRKPLTRLLLQSTLLTAACIATYAGIRLVPVEPCEFLHYGDYVDADGVIEGCGYEETQFFDMDALRFPILAKVTPLGEAKVGEELLMKLTLFTSQGRPIELENIAVSHTERVHALIIDPSLDDYQHIHPQAAGPPGHYTFTMTPHNAGEYSVYLDFILLATGRRTLVSTSFHVHHGDEAADALVTTPADDFALVIEGGTARANEDVVLHLDLQTGADSAIFQPVMGSYAHLVAFQENRSGFAHLHPRNPFIREQDPRNPDLSFSIRLDEPGTYRIWAQLNVNGSERFIPFDLKVEG